MRQRHDGGCCGSSARGRGYGNSVAAAIAALRVPQINNDDGVSASVATLPPCSSFPPNNDDIIPRGSTVGCRSGGLCKQRRRQQTREARCVARGAIGRPKMQ